MAFLLVVAWAGKTCAQVTIDYTHARVLDGLPGCEPGYTQHHVKADNYGLTKFRETIADTPKGAVIQFDWEPWVQGDYPWYGEASDEENLEMLRRYAWLIREVTPDLAERDLTLAVYSVPVLLQRNWVYARIDDREHSWYRRWRGKQVRLIQQAEVTGFLPALRAAGGHVLVVGYIPKSWHDQPSGVAGKWLEQVIENVDEVLDEHDVPHRWLWRPTSPELMRVARQKTAGRDCWWEDQPATDELEYLPELVRETARHLNETPPGLTP